MILDGGLLHEHQNNKRYEVHFMPGRIVCVGVTGKGGEF
jgi:hypothetical protein